MTLLVISDTHRVISNAVSLINDIKPDYVLHLGDVCDDCERLSAIFPDRIVLGVIGNNDYPSRYPSYPAERVFTLDGVKIYMCHGHLLGVRSGTEALKTRAKALKAQIALFGHTHIKHFERTDSLVVMNPGSVHSYGIIEINNGQINARTEDYDKR